jgi:hypothetical protein
MRASLGRVGGRVVVVRTLVLRRFRLGWRYLLLVTLALGLRCRYAPRLEARRLGKVSPNVADISAI